MANPVAGGRAPAGKRETLSRIPFFAEAPAELRKAITDSATIVRLGAVEYFPPEGESCAHCAVVVSGGMRAFKLGESGQEITLYHVGAGEACPLNVSCILSDRPVPAMARVEEDVEALVVPAPAFSRWIAEYEPLRRF